MGSIRWLLLQSEEAQKKRGESKNRPDQLKKKLQKTRRIICSKSQQRVHSSTIQRIQQPMDMAKIKSKIEDWKHHPRSAEDSRAPDTTMTSRHQYSTRSTNPLISNLLKTWKRSQTKTHENLKLRTKPLI